MKIQLAKRLHEQKLKATPARMNVLEVISNYGKAIPFSKIQSSLQNIDRVTLYRTIHILTKNGIIHEALIGKNETFYAICSTKCSTEGHTHKHIHFKCTECNSVTCVDTIQPVNVSIANHIIKSIDIEAFGICDSCVKK